MTINRHQLLNDQDHRREVITHIASEITMTARAAGIYYEVAAEWMARDLLAKTFDAPELRDTVRFPA
jgi:hypothetical protein